MLVRESGVLGYIIIYQSAPYLFNSGCIQILEHSWLSK